MARQRCSNLGGNLFEISESSFSHFYSLENGNNWLGFKFPNSSFRWFNNETGASQIINCFEDHLNATFKDNCMLFRNCCYADDVVGRCFVECFLGCVNCSNSSVVPYICSKGKGVLLKIKVENIISSLLSAKRTCNHCYLIG